jgi:hypothetical protein
MSLVDFVFCSHSLTFNKRRPKFIVPESYLEPELQNLFDLCYFVGKELVPTGWNYVDEDKTYPSLLSRNPQVSQTADESDNDHDMTNGRATSESSEDGSPPVHSLPNTTRMTEEDESDDEIASLPRSRVSRKFYPLFYPFPLLSWRNCLCGIRPRCNLPLFGNAPVRRRSD